MTRLELGPFARADVDALAAYLEHEASPAFAQRTVNRILDRLLVLEDNPLLGVARPELGESRRCFLIRPYVAIYEPTPTIVMVLRIVHGARDLPTLLADLR